MVAVVPWSEHEAVLNRLAEAEKALNYWERERESDALMATYTAVLVVSQDKSQGWVEEQLGRVGVLAFFGAGVQVPAWRRNDARESVKESE